MTATARRSAPLGRTTQFERATTDHRSGAGTIIVGPRGCGRTTLAAAVATDAERNGRALLWVTASATLHAEPFGVFASTFDADAPATPVERIAAVLSALRFHGGAAPTTLIIDDLHLLDEWSAAIVLQALSTRAVALVATAVAGMPLPTGMRQVVDDGFVDVLDLDPFDHHDVERIASDLLGGPPAPSTVELLWRWSDGMPGTLQDIVQIGHDDSRFRLLNGCWWWHGPPPALVGIPPHVQRQIDRLSEAALEAFDLIALSDQVDVAVIEQLVSGHSLVELERADLIETMDREHVTTVRCSRMRMAHHRRSSMPTLRRRSLARRLLAQLPAPSTPAEITRSASLHTSAGQPASGSVMEQATSILRLSDPHGAQVLAEARHRAAPTVTTAVDLIDNCIEVGDTHGAHRLLAEAEPLATGPDSARRLTEAAFAIALFADRSPGRARQIIDERRSADGRVSGLEMSRSFAALAALLSARPDAADELARQALVEDSADACRLRAGVVITAAHLLRGQTEAARQTAAELLGSAVRLTGVMPSALGMLQAQMAFIQLWQGELTAVPGADPLTGRWPLPPLAEHAVDRQIDWALMAGIVAHLRGDHATAVARLNEAVVQQAQGKGIFHAEASAWLIVALCDAGRVTEAMRALQQFPERHLAILPGLSPWARGVVASTRGRDGEASDLLAGAADEARAVGAHLIEARYLVELAERCGDDRAIARIDELAGRVDAALLVALCRSAVARLKGDAAAMLASAAELDRYRLPARAKALARDAESVAVGSGENAVARDARRARRSMRGEPVRTGSNVAGLSPRELEVAHLAAGGMTDREIAARLVLSVRTIESHLASAYRKLAVSSRAHLAAALG